MTQNDLSAVKSLMESIPNFWHKKWTIQTLEKAFHAAGDLALIYKKNNQIIGCIFGYDCGFRGYLAGLAVSNEFHEKGIGKSLVQNVEDLLRKRGCELIITDALRSSQDFFMKCGWGIPQSILLRKRLIDK